MKDNRFSKPLHRGALENKEHECVYRDSRILDIVLEMVERGDSKETILGLADFYKNYEQYLPVKEEPMETEETLATWRLSKENIYFNPTEDIRRQTGFIAEVLEIRPGEYTIWDDHIVWAVNTPEGEHLISIDKDYIRSDLGYNPFLEKQG